MEESRAAMEEEITRRTRDKMMESRVVMDTEITRRTNEIHLQQERQMQDMFQSLVARLQLPGCSTSRP
ncbi:hypothetical protein QJS10_CPA07g00656 [Acorus calamus]|uniref:Uncharacterized protein n=1 Tax=Acorus calamus TaxID=4465 RepID=A0AAV9EIN6_ACOCL|nr:hypothetical protein QJS10_CPA07g00656 [Acorus calamus]